MKHVGLAAKRQLSTDRSSYFNVEGAGVIYKRYREHAEVFCTEKSS